MKANRVLMFAPLFPPAWRGGGPVKSSYAIARTAASARDVRVITRDTDLGEREPLEVERNRWIESQGVCVAYTTVKSLRRYARVLWGARRWSPEVLYFNSFFDFPLTILPQVLGVLGWWKRPTPRRVIAVRGEFGAAALAIKSKKKRAFLHLFKALRMHNGVVWHASSERELADIRAVMGEEAVGLVRRNDTLLPAPSPWHQPSSRVEGDPLRAIFIGRIVPIKGLDVLIQALAQVSGDLRLDIYGPEEDPTYARRCRRLASEVSDSVCVTFHGSLAPHLVRPTIANADLFLMPTKGENFGQVIAEALSCAVPVMLMDVTPWTGVVEAGGGVLVREDTPEAWAAEISRYSGSSATQWAERRGDAARAYARWFEDSPKGDLFGQLGQAMGGTMTPPVA